MLKFEKPVKHLSIDKSAVQNRVWSSEKWFGIKDKKRTKVCIYKILIAVRAKAVTQEVTKDEKMKFEDKIPGNSKFRGWEEEEEPEKAKKERSTKQIEH